MQSKLKYKLYGEFDNYEVAELSDWLRDTLTTANLNKMGSIKITLDWEPAGDAGV